MSVAHANVLGRTATRAPLDIDAIRRDFPVLAREVNGKPLCYLDNAASSQRPHAVIGGPVLRVDGAGLREQFSRRVAAPQTVHCPAHALEGPEEIDRRGTGARQPFQVGVQVAAPVGSMVLEGVPGRQNHTVGRRNADGRCPANHHGCNGLGHGRGTVAGDEAGLIRQVALVEEMQAPVVPDEGVVRVHGKGVADFHGGVLVADSFLLWPTPLSTQNGTRLS